MDSIHSDSAVEQMMMLWAEKSQKGKGLDHDAIQKDSKQNKKNPESNLKIIEFSDEDIDKILKANKIKISHEHRVNARFLLRRHFTIQKPMFDMIDQIIPGAILKGHYAEAFIAAASKLPLEDVVRGYQILLETIEAPNSTVVSEINDFIGTLKDLVSKSFNLNQSLIDPELMRSFFMETLDHWDDFIHKNTVQLKWMVERKQIIRHMLNYKRHVTNLMKVLQLNPNDETQNFLNQLKLSLNKADLTIKILLSDAILSRYDAHHHLMDQGACYSVGTMMQGHALPVRMWVSDKEKNSNDLIDPDSIVLFFRWTTKEIGLIEAEVVTQKETIKITFATGNKDVAGTINDESERLKQRLIANGFEVQMEPCVHVTKIKNEETKIEHLKVDKVNHLDAKA